MSVRFSPTTDKWRIKRQHNATTPRTMRVVLLALLLSLALADQGCPPGAFLSIAGDKCFHPVPALVDFRTAEIVCASFGGHLASVHDKWDNDALIGIHKEILTQASKNLVADHFGTYWLGGRDVNSSGSWTWIDGSSFNYNNWAAGGGMAWQNCLLLDGATALWQPYDCQQKAKFVCQTDIWVTQPSSPTVFVPSTTRTPTGPIFTATTTTPSTRTFPTTPTTLRCPGSRHSCIEGQCYVAVECALKWNHASSNCKAMKGQLASIHSAQVERLIVKEVYNYMERPFWIGGQLDKTGNLSWSDGTGVEYTNWNPGEPSNIWNDRCVAIYDGSYSKRWYTYKCSDAWPSVCVVPL
uniref:C-type lectin domain-containing protein n=1 Tax=Steinernema glaseri TaxID=37863 RepID=A0A1I7YR95_9BILA